MRKSSCVALFFIAALCVSAQDYTEEMNRLISYAVELRKPDSDELVLDKMMNDACWTLMDEIVIMTPDNECSLSELFKMKENMQMFGINDLAYQVEEKTERIITAGNFCNGTDPRYNYSFIERTIKNGSMSIYEIPQRKGDQIFLIIPFHKDTAKLNVSISCGENNFPGIVKNDGIIELKPVVRNPANDKMILSVTNESGQDVSYLIVNYNSRSEVN